MLRRRDQSTRTSEATTLQGSVGYCPSMAIASDSTQISSSPDQEIIKQELLSSVNKLIDMTLW